MRYRKLNVLADQSGHFGIVESAPNACSSLRPDTNVKVTLRGTMMDYLIG